MPCNYLWQWRLDIDAHAQPTILLTSGNRPFCIKRKEDVYPVLLLVLLHLQSFSSCRHCIYVVFLSFFESVYVCHRFCANEPFLLHYRNVRLPLLKCMIKLTHTCIRLISQVSLCSSRKALGNYCTLQIYKYYWLESHYTEWKSSHMFDRQ